MATTVRAQQWQYIASMHHPRASAQTVLLHSGKIFVMGGTDGSQVLSTCELYDPFTNTWSNAATMHVPRYVFQANVLNDGRVFVSGGLTDLGNQTTAACEIYSPSSDTWALGPSMSEAREGHSACVLPGNKVILMGGLDANTANYLSSVDIFDETSSTITPLESMPSPRAFAGAVYAPSANAVFVWGGDQAGWGGFKTRITQKYSLSNGHWTLLDSMIDRQGALFNALLSPTSNDLFVFTNDTGYTTSAPHVHLTSLVESLDLSSGMWRAFGTITPRTDPRTVLVDDSAVMPGCLDSLGNPVATVSWFDLTTGHSWDGARLQEPISEQGIIYLPDVIMENNCDLRRRLYVIGGYTTGKKAVVDCEMLDLGDVPGASMAQLHRESGASFFGNPDTLPLVIDVSSQINLDSLWPYIQTISGAYSWDSSVVNYEAYAPPAGWVTTSLSAFGDSVAFTIRKLSGSVTSPLSLGTGVFLPGTERLASTWVSLSMLTLQIGSKTVPVCVSANEDSHWSVKVLGTDGVTSPPNETGALSVQSVQFENGMIVLAYHDSLINPRPLHADVFDILGRKVISEEIGYSSSPTILDHRLAKGAYYIRLSDGQSTVFQRVMQSVP